MMKTRWANCVLVLALAALPALAEVEGAAEVESEAPAVDGDATAGDAAEATPEASPEPLTGRVLRASFTTQVVDREPQDSVTSLTSDQWRIFFFTEFIDLEGHTLTHLWEREGIEMARVPFVVGGPRWRVYSTKNLGPSWLGEWKVSVLDENDRVLHSENFSYVSAPAQPILEEGPAVAEEAAAPAEEAAAPAEEAAVPSEETPEPGEEPAVPAAIE
jgi:hypothetical protein